MVYDDSGNVYIEHWNSNPTEYTSANFNVSIGAVPPELAAQLVEIKIQTCNCANGVYRQKFFYANENNVSIWKTGHLP